MLRRSLALVAGATLALGVASPGTALAAPPGPSPKAATAAPAAAGSYNNLAATPPMGWNDWYAFKCNVSEQLVEQTADAMVSSGMAAAGYDYVNLDDCWLSNERDANGNLQADPTKFPDGIKAVADYVHARGMKLGIYEDVGTKTCAGYPGSYGHVQQDADTFASWGIDFVKVDWCNVPFGDFPGLTQQQVAEKLYTQYSEALKATGRPMFFSICEWNPALQPWTWAPAISNMWRSNNDYGDSWSQVVANLDQEADLAQYAGPGHWNDPDILQVGLGGMSEAQDQAQFSAWSMLAAPLLAGNDVRSMSASTKAILTNHEMIAVDQDRLGAEATRISHSADADVWARPLSNGDSAVMLFNRGNHAETISTTASAVGLPQAVAYSVRDLWMQHTSESAGLIAASVPANSAMLYRVRPLHSALESYPPLTDVSVTPDVPAAYPGSPYHIASPGQTIKVSAKLRNDGRVPVADTRVTVQASQGWTVVGRPVTTRLLMSGGSSAGSWRVTVPESTAPGTYSLTADATYHYQSGRGGRARSRSAGTGTLQVLVPPKGQLYASDLTPLSSSNGYGPVVLDRSYFGGPLTIHGVTYTHGMWTNAIASIEYYLGANCTRFTADLGLDDSVKGKGTVDYTISADGQQIYDSGVVTNTTPTQHVNVDVSGAHVLRIDVGDGGDGVTYDNADIAIPQLTCAS